MGFGVKEFLRAPATLLGRRATWTETEGRKRLGGIVKRGSSSASSSG